MSLFSILCSGQGAQTSDLFERFPFTEKGLTLKQQALDEGGIDPDVVDWLANPTRKPEAIFQNHFSQPLLCLYQAMVWAEIGPLLPQPAVICGYSLGEVSAYGCAGAMSLNAVVKLAGTRAKLMDGAGPRGELIAVTGLSPQNAAKLEGAHLAIVIGEDHCVIGCVAERAEGLAEELRKSGAKSAAILAVTVASHTAILDAAVEPFREVLREAAWQMPRIPVLAGINATKVMRQEQMLATLPEQIHRTIRWDLIQQRLLESGSRVLLEIGPGHQLARMGSALGAEARGVDEFRSPEGVAAWVQAALKRAG